MGKYKLSLLFALLALSFSALSQDRMDWWREARFGMFIHWGPYAVYGNIYDGLDVNGEETHHNMVGTGLPAEWIMNSALIPRSEYRKAAMDFDAKDYDPQAWVQLAKNAGMKYIVITTKHHDGFCLFDTEYTDWNAVESSGAKRDLLDGLAKATKEAGLKLGFYYSQNRDWMAEGGMGPIPELSGGLYSVEKVNEYVDHLVIPQIKELASRYDFDLFWFDGPGMANSNDEIAEKIHNALMESEVGTHVIMNNRLYTGWPGDYETPETDTPTIPYNGYADNRDWEACSSLNNSWGWEDCPKDNWKSDVYTISRVLELASKGGNFLLNVGPDKHGVIPEEAQNTLRAVGEWMSRNGEGVYGTTRNQLLNPFEYGYVTEKTEEDGSLHYYLHISSGYWTDRHIYLDGILNAPTSAKILATGESLNVLQEQLALKIALPEECKEDYYTTIDLHFASRPPQIKVCPIREDSKIRLTPFQAATSGSIRKDFAPYAFKNWYHATDVVEFEAYLTPGVYTIETEYAALNPGNLFFSIDKKTYTAPYEKTSEWAMDNYIEAKYEDVKIYIKEPGIYPLKITREIIPNVFGIINLRQVKLVYVSETSLEPVEKDFFIGSTVITNGILSVINSSFDSYRIYDLQGKTIMNFEGTGIIPVNVSHLPKGIYIVSGSQRKESRRIVVK